MKNIEKGILGLIQSGFPVVGRPYAEIGRSLGWSEGEIVAGVLGLKDQGLIRRMGAVFEAGALGYVSTLVAAAVAEEKMEAFVGEVNALSGVSHNYRRGHRLNVWFTLTMRSAVAIGQVVAGLRGKYGLEEIYNLPAKRRFKMRVEFEFGQERGIDNEKYTIDNVEFRNRNRIVDNNLDSRLRGNDSEEAVFDGLDSCLRRNDSNEAISGGLAGSFYGNDSIGGNGGPAKELKLWQVVLVRALQGDVAVVSEPFEVVAETVGVAGADVVRQIEQWKTDGVIRRFGAVLGHRAAGYLANGMVVMAVGDERVEEAGAMLAGYGQVSHCYERERAAGWAYNLFAMTHCRSKGELQAVVADMVTKVGPDAYDVLVSVAEYKKSSVQYFRC